MLPKLRMQLKNGATPIDVTTAAVTLKRVRRSDGVEVPLVGTVAKIDALNGIVEYSWVPADVADAGVYDCTWKLAWVDGTQTVPTNCFVRVHVRDA
ncbi:MAG: hypothetical protein IT305_26080 [Chloroflexi bacterium]|nr:hypothetical protein [Chloroflexota bacterium]